MRSAKGKLRHEPQYASVFISFSRREQTLAKRLYDDLQRVGVVAWKWDEDSILGENVWEQISRAIHSHEKVLLLLSSTSLASRFVDVEIEMALERERKKGWKRAEAGNVLIPLRVDDFEIENWISPHKKRLKDRIMGDARGVLSNPKDYRRLFSRILRCLDKSGHVGNRRCKVGTRRRLKGGNGS